MKEKKTKKKKKLKPTEQYISKQFEHTVSLLHLKLVCITVVGRI